MPEQERERLEQKESEKTAKAKKDFDLFKMFDSIGPWVKDNIRWILASCWSHCYIIGWRLFVSRRKWLPKILVPYYRSGQKDWAMYAKRYKSLLKQLDRFGMKRKSGETLSTYAIQVDAHFGGDTMRKLTISYEKGIYGGDKEEPRLGTLTGTVGRFNQ